MAGPKKTKASPKAAKVAAKDAAVQGLMTKVKPHKEESKDTNRRRSTRQADKQKQALAASNEDPHQYWDPSATEDEKGLVASIPQTEYDKHFTEVFFQDQKLFGIALGAEHLDPSKENDIEREDIDDIILDTPLTSYDDWCPQSGRYVVRATQIWLERRQFLSRPSDPRGTEVYDGLVGAKAGRNSVEARRWRSLHRELSARIYNYTHVLGLVVDGHKRLNGFLEYAEKVLEKEKSREDYFKDFEEFLTRRAAPELKFAMFHANNAIERELKRAELTDKERENAEDWQETFYEYYHHFFGLQIAIHSVRAVHLTIRRMLKGRGSGGFPNLLKGHLGHPYVLADAFGHTIPAGTSEYEFVSADEWYTRKGDDDKRTFHKKSVGGKRKQPGASEETSPSKPVKRKRPGVSEETSPRRPAKRKRSGAAEETSPSKIAKRKSPGASEATSSSKSAKAKPEEEDSRPDDNNGQAAEQHQQNQESGWKV